MVKRGFGERPACWYNEWETLMRGWDGKNGRCVEEELMIQ